jgi:hypothetical protein
MATQKCPKCKSYDIRQGYRPTPLLLKILCIYNLLCDNCNWEFRGFGLVGTVPRKTKRRKNARENALGKTDSIGQLKVEDVFDQFEVIEISKKQAVRIEPQLAMTIADNYLDGFPDRRKSKSKRRVRVKLH